jgi:predicted outer membrane repeat protein
MKIPRKNRMTAKWAILPLCCAVALGAIPTPAGASVDSGEENSTARVGDFTGLLGAIGNNDKTTIDFTSSAINFINENNDYTGISIDRSLTMSGLATGTVLNLNGKKATEEEEEKNSFFKLTSYTIWNLNFTFKNLHFQGGYNNDKFNNVGGGAIHLNSRTTATFENATFSNNTAEFHGGAIFFLGVAKEGEEEGNEGGGMEENTPDNIIFTGKTVFSKNKAIGVIKNEHVTIGTTDGGAIHAANSKIDFRGDAVFEGNSASGSGGAIDLRGEKSTLIFEKTATFENNSSAKGSGGVITAGNSEINFGGDAVFEGNSASGNGGAIDLQGEKNTLNFEKIATFENNSSVEGSGGAISAENS